MEERQAIALLQRHDLTGLETLVEAYQAQAVQAACLIVQDRALAEEIVQNAFIVAAQKIHQYDPQRPFKPWFFRSVVNASIKAANRQKRQVSLDETQPGQELSLADLLADPGPLPEDWLELEQNRVCVLQAVDRLPPDQRAVIVMRYFLEVSEAEMAGELRRPQSTIKYWLRTALKQLRRLLLPWHAAQTKAEPSLPLPERPEKPDARCGPGKS
jgi:RNA polymerase sigma-70 factor, ECF subfamily